MDDPEAQYLIKKHDQMIDLLQELEKNVLDQWTLTTPFHVHQHLQKPMLLRTKEDNLLMLNFDPFVR